MDEDYSPEVPKLPPKYKQLGFAPKNFKICMSYNRNTCDLKWDTIHLPKPRDDGKKQDMTPMFHCCVFCHHVFNRIDGHPVVACQVLEWLDKHHDLTDSEEVEVLQEPKLERQEEVETNSTTTPASNAASDLEAPENPKRPRKAPKKFA